MTTLIVAAIVSAVMVAGAATYHATDGFGAGNKVKSSLDVQRERKAQELAAAAQEEIDNSVESNGRYFVAKQNRNITQPTQSTQTTKPAQYTQVTLPTVKTLPTLQTGYNWQEYTPAQYEQRKNQASQLFVDKYDTRANNGPLSSLINTYKDSGKFLENAALPRWALALCTLGFSEIYALNASAIDNFIWDIDGDGQDSMIKNLFVDPWIEVSNGNATWGQALLATALNTLSGATEVLDIFANPIKGIANDGWQGFLNSFGLGGNGYVAYDWDTGNFALDLLAEIFSDPLTVIGAVKTIANLGIKGGKRALTKTGAEIGQETAEKVGKEATQELIEKSTKEATATLTTKIQSGIAPKFVSKTGKNLTPAAQREVSKLVAQELAQRGISNLSDEALETIYKSVLNGLEGALNGPLSATALKKLAPELAQSATNKAVNTSLKTLTKEASTKSLKKFYKALSKTNVLNAKTGSRASRSYARKLTDIVDKAGTKTSKKLGRGINAGSITQVVTEGGKPTIKTIKTVNKVDDVFKASGEYVQGLEEEMFQKVVASARKAGVPISDSTMESMRSAVTKYFSDLNVDKMTAQIMSTSGVITQQAKILRADKFTGWLSKAAKEADILQSGLNKIALYGTAPALPLLGKALGNTPTIKLLKRGAQDLMTVIFAKLTNNTAANFQYAVAKAAQDLTPETYALQRNVFSFATENAVKELTENVLVDSKKVIQENKLLPQTAEGAYQRQWVSKFTQDTRAYNAIRKEAKGDVNKMSKNWENYIRTKYKKSATEYLQFMEAINKIEQDATGTAIYSPFINRIKINNAFIEASTLNNAITDPTLKSTIQFVSPKVPQGNTLSASQLQELNPNLQIISAEEYDKMQATLADNQVFIQTNNKVIVEQELYSELNKLVDDFDYYEGTEGLLAELKKIGKELYSDDSEFNVNLALLETKIRDAQNLNRQLELFRANPALYAVVDAADKQAQKELYVCLADAFMGLNNKVKGLDDVVEVAYELAAIAELQLKTRGILKEIPTGFLTQDSDFMTNLISTMQIYMDTLPNQKFVVSELKDAVPIVKNLQSHLEINGIVSAKQLQELYDNLQQIVAKTSDEILILPTLAYRAGVDVINDASIHEALMKAANGNFAGTLTTIANGVNMSSFFSGVNLDETFDRAVVENTQKMADDAAQIHNRIYHAIKTEEAIARVNTGWNDILDTLARSGRMGYDDYAQYVKILETTRNLDANKQYALMRYLYDLDTAPSLAVAEMHNIVKDVIDAPANAELYRDIKNYAHMTNKPVPIGTGSDVRRARKTVLTDPNQRAVADLANITSEANQMKRSAESLELQIKNVSNADPMLAQHLKQTKKLSEFQENVEHYKELVEDSVNQKAIQENLEIAMSDDMLDYLDEEDITTLRDMYYGVEDIDPDRITQLEQRVDAYNKTVLSSDYFEYELEKIPVGVDNRVEDFAAIRRKVKNNETLTSAETERWKRYKKVSDDYDDFVYLMTKPDLTEAELKRLDAKFGAKLQVYDLTPNAIRNFYTEQYKLANQTRIRIKSDVGGGVTKNAGRRIEIDKSYLRNYPRFQYIYKHETVHSALTFNDIIEHRKQVNQYWNMLMNSENKEMAENLYLATWWRYKKDPSAAHYFFGSDIFTWDNNKIKEEVMANVIAGQNNPKEIQKLLASYSKSIPDSELRLYRVNAKAINYTDEFIMQNDTVFNQLIENTVNKSPNKIYDLPQMHSGERLIINKPFNMVGDIMREYRQAERTKLHNMFRKRLSQGAEDFAKDLARTGPFQFYSISELKNTQGRYSINKYFYFGKDEAGQEILKFNKAYQELENAGVHIKYLPEDDTILFYIDKDRVSYYKGHSYYNKQLVDYEPVEFDYAAKHWTTINDTGRAFNDAAHEIAGTTLGYSSGFRIDDNFINTLFNGTKDGFSSEFPSWKGLSKVIKEDFGGWTQADLLQPLYFSNYRFNEMIMGNYDYARRFGIYQSSNPIVNMNNALQQMQMMNKSKMEMLTMYFDDTFSIAKGGIWEQYTDQQLYDAYMTHPEMTFVTMRGKIDAKGNLTEQTTSKFTKVMLGDSWNPVRVQEFIPRSVKDIATAREIGVRLVPRSWYNQMYNTINNRIGSAGVLKYINRMNFIYKFFTLATNAMTFVRNAFDTYLKNTVELGSEMPQWTAYAWQLQADYQDIVNALQRMDIHGDKAIKEFFDSGMAKAYLRNNNLTYEMFIDLKNYEAWGPSTDGLADLVKAGAKGTADIGKYADDISPTVKAAIEPTDDELMRIIARDTVPGYKGVWENAVDMSGKVFDVANNTIGVKAEKVNRLALYMKALSEGKTREQAFHWITKTHFDYSVRNLYEQSIEVLMPFMTFTTKNLTYWLETIATKPWATKLLMDYFQTQWNYYDFTPEQMAASNQFQFLIKSGNIPLYKRDDGIVSYFKLSPSFADAFNTFINPIEVAKDRLFFPTKALEKTFTEDYKGQSLMGKQDTWNKVLDWTSQVPGNALARRITNAVKQDSTLPIIGESLGATGHIKVKPYTPKKYGYKQRMQFVYSRNKENNRHYYQTHLTNQPFRYTQKPNNAYKYQQISRQVERWRMARNLDWGKRILDPYRALGQKLAKQIFFDNTLSRTSTGTTQVQKKWLSLTQYRVQTALFR